METNLNQIESATYKRYNANTSGKSSPDCVKRAISMAFNISYVKVGQDLNKIMHEKRRSAWNISSVYETYISQLGGSDVQSPDTTMTVEQFADEYPEGAYILETSPKPNKIHGGNHLTCVIDNVLYDSWDSSGQYVVSYYICGNTRHVEMTDIQDHWKELADIANEEINKNYEKFIDKYQSFKEVTEGDFFCNKTYAKGYSLHKDMVFWCRDDNESYLKYTFTLSYVFTPETTLDAAKKQIVDVTKVRMYDRFYTINKLWIDKLEETRARLEYHDEDESRNPNTRLYMDAREKKFYNSLPPQLRPRVTYVRISEPGRYSDSYRLDFKPLPGDDNKKEVSLSSYTSSGMKEEINLYINHGFQRLDYDYYISDIE